jgi:hypothetical protein
MAITGARRTQANMRKVLAAKIDHVVRLARALPGHISLLGAISATLVGCCGSASARTLPPFSLSIRTLPNPVTFGGPCTVDGKLSGIPFKNGEVRYEVVLQADPFPYSAGSQDLGEPGLTDGAGNFSFSLRQLAVSSELRVILPGTPVASPTIREGVAVRVTLHESPTRRKGYVHLYGSVAPAIRAPIGFQRIEADGMSVNRGGAATRKTAHGISTFSRTLPLPPGLYRALVPVAAGAYLSAESPPVLIR